MPTLYELSLSENDGDVANDNQEEISKALAYKNLPLKDKIMMGPLDKYQKYSKQSSNLNFIQTDFHGK